MPPRSHRPTSNARDAPAVWDVETLRAERTESLLLEGKLIKDTAALQVSFAMTSLPGRQSGSERRVAEVRLARFRKDDGDRYFGP